MDMRNYKDTNEMVSLLGFGCMRLPLAEKDKQDINYEEAEKMVDFAIKNGVNYFDTAYIYHDGTSETFIGQTLKKYPRKSFYLANKMPIWLLENSEDTERIFNEQLEKCSVEYFDYYLLHNLDDKSFAKSERLGVYDFLKKKKEQGKIHKLGFSFHDKACNLDMIIDTHEWDFCQLQINYLDWELQDAKYQYEAATIRGVPVIVMEPVRGGALAGLSDDATALLKNERPKDSIASWAIRYAAQLSNVLTVLSGMSNMEQLKDNLETLSSLSPMTEGEHEVLQKALIVYRSSGAIPCTACRYCMECPAGVDIPKVFTIYNQYMLSQSSSRDFTFTFHYNILGSEKQAYQCTECGQCEPLCPQGIQIPERLKEVTAQIEELKKKDD